MKTYTFRDKPLKVFGVPFFEETGSLERVPAELREKLPLLELYGRRSAGARIGFRTDAKEFIVKVTLETMEPDVGISIYGAQTINVMVGDRQNSVFASRVSPFNYDMKTFEATVSKSAEMEDVTLWLMRNEVIENIEVVFPDDARVEEPTPYKYGKALYYGSSITEGASCTMVTNNYIALLSRWLDLDFYNLGFSGAAKGDIEMADYINTIDMSVFVMDYDYNAVTVDDLERTHEPFFRRIREKNPTLPVLIMSRPSFEVDDTGAKRRDIIKKTYNNAVESGDKNVYFLDGETFFGTKDRTLCTVDCIHPNDLGFYRMAEIILPVMKRMLNID